jgi:hypothetical protein
VVVALGLLIGLAILKPWAAVVPAGDGGDPSGFGRRAAGTPSGTASAAPTASPDRERALVSSFCLEPSGWRLFASERWAGRAIRGWKSIEPATTADGPGDPGIPLVPQASRAVLTLGYCAPVDGPDRPPGPTVTTIYRQVTDPNVRPGAVGWETIAAPRLAPVGPASELGAVWGPPRATGGAGPSRAPDGLAGWGSGVYIFRIGNQIAGDATFERWFGVVVEVLPDPAR